MKPPKTAAAIELEACPEKKLRLELQRSAINRMESIISSQAHGLNRNTERFTTFVNWSVKVIMAAITITNISNFCQPYFL